MIDGVRFVFGICEERADLVLRVLGLVGACKSIVCYFHNRSCGPIHIRACVIHRYYGLQAMQRKLVCSLLEYHTRLDAEGIMCREEGMGA